MALRHGARQQLFPIVPAPAWQQQRIAGRARCLRDIFYKYINIINNFP
jgi:hypothetical protein